MINQTNDKLQITNYKLQITNYKLQITNYKLQIGEPRAQLDCLPGQRQPAALTQERRERIAARRRRLCVLAWLAALGNKQVSI